jgi:hypothetical protein
MAVLGTALSLSRKVTFCCDAVLILLNASGKFFLMSKCPAYGSLLIGARKGGGAGSFDAGG